MSALRLFVPITKVDEQRRLVIGRLAQEVPDRAGEIFDYESSKPYFKAWSESFQKATEAAGQEVSFGNMRAMHGKTAAGKFTQIDFNDTDKAIDVIGKVIDDNEWQKVLEGVYTGYSIGGDYVGDKKPEKIDGKSFNRYTARPSEGSLVDSPCIPTAKFFEVVKADGAIQKVAFRPPEYEVAGTDDEVGAFAKAMHEAGLTMKDALAMVGEAVLRKADDIMLDTVEAMEKREFSPDARKAAAKKGAALPDGSFPIESVGDLENAVRAYGRAKDKAAAKAHIIKRAKALGASDKIPEAWTKGGKADGAGELEKGMWTVSDFASCLLSISSIASSAQWDLEAEGDASPIPLLLRNWLSDGIDIFQAMSKEESTELLETLKSAANVPPQDGIDLAIANAVKLGALRKQLADPDLPVVDLVKIATEHGEPITTAVLGDLAGLVSRIVAKAARSAATDAAHLQEAHDHLTAMGAACGAGKGASGGDLSKAAAEASELTKTVQAMQAEIDKLKAQPMPHRIMLRAVSKTEDNGTAPTKPAAIAGEPSIDLRPDQLIRNADGSIDYATSRFLAVRKTMSAGESV